MGPKLLYQQDPVRGSVKALGSKWTLLILRDIGFLKLERFGQILRNNPWPYTSSALAASWKYAEGRLD
jgi:DNA-binding HxlR family transcriptional regulator